MTSAERAAHRDYIRAWKRSRRRAAVKHLGGKCVDCGSKRRLEFDHLDRDNKLDRIARLMCARAEVFWAEVDKCVLRCHRCHVLKGLAAGDYVPLAAGLNARLRALQVQRALDAILSPATIH